MAESAGREGRIRLLRLSQALYGGFCLVRISIRQNRIYLEDLVMRNNSKFILPNGYGERQLISQFSDHFSIKKERSVLKNFTFYDTFDWRLFNKSFVLYASGNQLFLRKLFKNENIYSAEIARSPVFIRDFPDSRLKEQLAPIIKMRALLKLVVVKSRLVPCRILNLDEKTVVRLVYEEIRPFNTNDTLILATYLWLKPVKGYPKHSQRLTEQCQESGFLMAKKEDMKLFLKIKNTSRTWYAL
jgi:hypothetical protein